jgi:phosphonate transport system substrate-binding protein
MVQCVSSACRVFGVVAAVVLWSQMTWAGPLNLGSISMEPADENKKFLPLADYLAKHLQSEGIDQGKVVVAKSIPQMAAFLREGKVDLYIDSPFPSVAVSRLSRSQFLLRRWKKGVGEYHSVIFARTDSGIERLADLKGRIIAFEEPFSSSGYFLPKMVLAEAGYRLVRLQEIEDPVSRDDIGYVFSNDDENTMIRVLRGKVAAGAMDQENYVKLAKNSLDRLKIVHRTFSVPRHVVNYRADLPASVVARVKALLLDMEQSEEGKAVLHAFEKTTKFDELPERGLEPLLEATQFIEAEFGR